MLASTTPIQLTTGSLLIFVGYLFRAVPVLVELSPSTRFYLGWAGHFLVGFGIPFVSFTPSKVSEHWFPERQRLLSITLISMGNLIGLMLSDLLVEKILALGYDIGYMVRPRFQAASASVPESAMNQHRKNID